MRAIIYVLGIVIPLALAGCDEGVHPGTDPYDTGYFAGGWAAKAQRSKGRTPDLVQTLNGRNDLAQDAGYAPGTEGYEEYKDGFKEGYTKEFGIK